MLTDDANVTAAWKELGADLSHVWGKLKAGDHAESLAGYFWPKFWVSVHDSVSESYISGSRATEALRRLPPEALWRALNALWNNTLIGSLS